MEHIPIEGDDALHQTPEQRERLLIASIVIPADDEQPLRQEQLDATNLDDYQDLVSGNIEVLSFTSPAASLYLNTEGKHLGQPMNGRATMLLWAHLPELRYRDYIAGDAFLVGTVDEEGWDRDVPDSFTETLFRAEHFRVEVQVHGDPRWYANEQRFEQWTEAYANVLDLGRRWSQVADLRIVPEG
jgi:Domain of unknown function (DUF3846)